MCKLNCLKEVTLNMWFLTHTLSQGIHPSSALVSSYCPTKQNSSSAAAGWSVFGNHGVGISTDRRALWGVQCMGMVSQTTLKRCFHAWNTALGSGRCELKLPPCCRIPAGPPWMPHPLREAHTARMGWRNHTWKLMRFSCAVVSRAVQRNPSVLDTSQAMGWGSAAGRIWHRSPAAIAWLQLPPQAASVCLTFMTPMA